MVNDQEQRGIDLDISKLGWRSMDELDREDDEEEEEEVPSHLNTTNSSGFLVVSTDKLSVQYTRDAMHGHDVGAVQSNCPAPSRRLVYYFEIYVKDAGQKGVISIGFTNDRFKTRRQPGWESNSYGYHADDGMLYHGQGKGEIFGPKFTTGDTVGGGINYASQEFFFTKNGKLVGTYPKDVKGPLFPTIGVHSQHEKVDVNFGQRPFLFDVEGYASEERAKQQMAIEKMSLPLSVSHWIVRSYLLHYGYQDTLNSFDTASKNMFPPVPIDRDNSNGLDALQDLYALSHRKLLRQLIRNGDIDSAFGKLRESYPQLVQDENSTICFMLHCQRFIELVRVGLLENAVAYGKAELLKYFGIKHMEGLLQDCLALLAYVEPSKSSVGYLLDMAQREVVADAVNALVLSTNPNMKNSQNCLHSSLEKLLRQLTACCLEKRTLNGDQGEAFHLHRVLHGTKGGKW